MKNSLGTFWNDKWEIVSVGVTTDSTQTWIKLTMMMYWLYRVFN